MLWAHAETNRCAFRLMPTRTRILVCVSMGAMRRMPAFQAATGGHPIMDVCVDGCNEKNAAASRPGGSCQTGARGGYLWQGWHDPKLLWRNIKSYNKLCHQSSVPGVARSF